MGQVEELKLFVAGRLEAAASEILAAIGKSIDIYEEEVAQLKEENKRHSSLLEIFLKKKLPQKQACHVTTSATVEATAKPAADCSTPLADEDYAAGPSALDSGVNCKTKKLVFSSTIGQQTVFISKEHLLNFSTVGNCLFCFKQVPATKHHLINRHYDIAVHFIQCGIGYTVLQPNQVKEEPSGLEDWDPEELSSLEQQSETASLQLKMKEQAATGKRRKVEDVQHIGNCQPEQYSIYLNQGQNPGMDFCLDDTKEVLVIENGATRVIETRQNSRFSKVLDPAGKMKHPNVTGVATKGKCNIEKSMTAQVASSCSDGFCQPSKKHTKTVKTELSASQNSIGSYYCKACGEIFNDRHKLKTHVQKHAGDKICICGICGRSLEHSESLYEHLQDHNEKNICGTCGREFSNQSRLQQHKRFHQSKTLNTKFVHTDG